MRLRHWLARAGLAAAIVVGTVLATHLAGFAQLCGLASESTHALLGRRLDSIYADPRFRAFDAAVLRTGPSDHWPVAATLAWRRTGTQ